MATLTIDGKTFDLDLLDDEAKSLTNAVSFCDTKISQLESELLVAKTARNSYVNQLITLLPKESAPAAKKAAPRKRKTTK